MIQRGHILEIKRKLSQFPAVVILGPRQCGKTTLAQDLGGRYYDMETEGSSARLDAEWNEAAAGEELTIIDEAQEVPEIFKRLRGTIDADRKRNGRYLLLGSVSPSLISGVSESLAGRVAFVEMSPLSLCEPTGQTMDSLWLYGGYPDGGVLDPSLFPAWQNSYLTALTTSDLPKWGMTASAQMTRRLLQMLAAHHGQPLNASQIGQALGIDHKTVQRYIDFLEGAFLLRNLPPYYANIKKRLVKRPRIYIRDSGLLHALMRIQDMDMLYGQPWLGQSWEGFIIEQTLTVLSMKNKTATPYYFRSSDGYELDLVLDWGVERWAIEIKLTSNPSKQEIDRLNKVADMVGATQRILLCRIEEAFGNETLTVTHPEKWLQQLSS
ncbi:ATP-binding protein [Coraliomargarita algicola]|uniref:ATP-binding protein n=1 Tax=Coraliomargarita algicola TaxID=3092156 RepID=A0ABZ0RRS4_9BACT|nr:ATP-binding protein [Coraliomargarita sp. J2-16]WPJ97873.1 ATP-binding protein [Coraliomargarita sp. J2-16]